MKLGKFLAGLGVGVVAGMLIAPKKGSELREDIKNESLRVYNAAKKMTKEDAEALLNQTIETIKKSVDEFDLEELKNMAVDKFEELKTQNKTNDNPQTVVISEEKLQEISRNLYDNYKNENRDNVDKMMTSVKKDISRYRNTFSQARTEEPEFGVSVKTEEPEFGVSVRRG